MRRRHVIAAGMALTSPALISQAGAQWMPRQPIRLLVGFAAGGTADQVARIAAEAMQRRGGPTVVVEIRTGALGFIALQAVARAAPDGLTLGIGIMGQLAVAPVVPGSVIPIDLDRELALLCNLAGTPMALVVPPGSPARTVAEFVALARARPGEITYASTGNGSTNQLGAEAFAAAAGIRMTHVAYRGGVPAALDVAAGRVDMLFANVAEVAEQVRGGLLRALALAADTPSPLLPELPLLTADYPALAMGNWFGLVGPAGLPAEVAGELGRMFLGAMAEPATALLLAARGMAAIPQDAAGFAAQIRRDRGRWAKVVAAGNIRAD